MSFERAIMCKEAEEKARKYNAQYIETSAVTQNGIKNLSNAIQSAVEKYSIPAQKIPEFSVEVEQPRWWFCF